MVSPAGAAAPAMFVPQREAVRPVLHGDRAESARPTREEQVRPERTPRVPEGDSGDRKGLVEPRPFVKHRPEDPSVRFNPVPPVGIIQGVVIDRANDEIVREAPSTQRIKFLYNFRKVIAESLGQKLDLKG